MAKEKKLVLMPPARLEPRPDDVALPADRFLKFSFFARLKRKPGVDRFPGTLVLRRFRQGEVICRQGEQGWTAFYVLTSEDVLALRQEQLQAATTDREKKALQDEITQLQQRLAQAKGTDATHPLHGAATVHLAVARPAQAGRGGVLGLLTRPFRRPRSTTGQPLYIPIDGPTDIPYDTRQATMYEGELFGEMSCQQGTPRSATVVAARDCYLLEMLRNILDQVQKDDGYKAQMDAVYKARVLQNHLRNLSIFSDLTDAQFAQVRDGVELIRCEGGEVICEEHDRSDGMYVIRQGLVKVVKGVSALLAVVDVLDWPALCARLREADQQPAGPRRHVWQRLPEPVRALVGRGAGPDALAWEERQAVVHALNDVLKDPLLPAAKEMQEVTTAGAFPERMRALPKDLKTWPAPQLRRFNRQVLEAVFPGVLRPLRHREGDPELILAYRARGEFLGETGLMTGNPRSATCVAYVHPVEGLDAAAVELVRIPEALFRQVIEGSPAVRQKVEQAAAAHRKSDVKRMQAPVREEGPGVALSGRFEELGLIQGRRLMLIDLDRCTRCDECVRACADTHDDGRTRLFLDGPRFGKYLVPTTCRSCLDPVCMIGCPVGSIHRGDNGQIVIEDWCIGCNLCAKNCPYGSIQMHDVGIVPEGAHGWRYQPASACSGDRWVQPRFSDRGWPAARAPFRYDRDLQDGLASVRGAKPGTAVCFRREFQLCADAARSGGQFRMEVTSTDAAAAVWLNGKEVTTEEKPKRGKREYPIAADGKVLRPGRNVVAVRATPTPGNSEVLFDLRLDEVRTPAVPLGVTGDVSEKPVTERAVVCDLCSQQYGKRPACVTACPHDAAMRVDARFEFPLG